MRKRMHDQVGQSEIQNGKDSSDAPKVVIMRKVSYDPLWKKLIDLGLSKTQMAERGGISQNTLAKLGKTSMWRWR